MQPEEPTSRNEPSAPAASTDTAQPLASKSLPAAVPAPQTWTQFQSPQQLAVALPLYPLAGILAYHCGILLLEFLLLGS